MSLFMYLASIDSVTFYIQYDFMEKYLNNSSYVYYI